MWQNGTWVKRGYATQRKLQMHGTAEETGNTDNQPIQPSTGTTHRPSTRHYRKPLRAAQETRRLTPTSTAAVHAPSTATTRHHYPHPTGSSPDLLCQCSRPVGLQSTGGLSRTITQTPPASAGTCSTSHLGGFGWVIFIVLGNARPLLLSPCSMLWLNPVTLL